ncbi:amidase family protein [Solirubrobacter phytolaccae]|uniref:Amidase family protein n=1 Tax=Solirubrobacter phytolaccae TaxID=1404360 RepID=A0A9X3SEM7_9ACTN|nr:amidase family protein [Solirubrobacter phytolaccae]MDA0185075.1 amidase family protein [Solirubrobacter phytolaccae]
MRRISLASAAACALLAASSSTAWAWTTVTNTNGDTWNVNDAADPGMDTGSIHNTGTNSLQGYGGLRVKVPGSPRMNGVLLRGFDLTADSPTQFTSKKAVALGGVLIKRSIAFNTSEAYARYLDTFTNTTGAPLTIEVAFGGQLGYNTGTNQSAIAATSSGDTTLTTADKWTVSFSPNAAGTATVNGTSATVPGTFDRTGNFLRDPFTYAHATSGDHANHLGYVNTLTLPAGATKALVRYVVTGLSETRAPAGGGSTPAAGSQVAAVTAKATALAAAPPLGDLAPAEACAIVNVEISAVTCGAAPAYAVGPIAGDKAIGATTSSPYNVVGKTITQLVADLKSGVTTSEQITQAYLDRIAAYDRGPFGLNSVITLAPTALAQAKAADVARKAGDTRPLLGIPILAKDIISTKDMPTTGGSRVFEGFQSTTDAWQVIKVREAGAIVLGKANLAEFATDGHFSPSAYGQVWNAYNPSISPIGSSGGSATAVASSFAAAAFGTQTGDSLWGPSSAVSLVSLRGTDGMQSSGGTMPLTYIQDYVGWISQSLGDLALLLNATAIANPADPLDDVSDGHRPADWTTGLDAGALQGKVIGVPATAFDDPFGTQGTEDAMRESFKHFVAAGATVKEIPDPPAGPSSPAGDRGYEGWRQWLLEHPNAPYTLAEQIMRSPLRLPQFRNTTPYTGTGAMTVEQTKAFEAQRAEYRARLATWMDTNGVDAVVFPGQLSDIHLNDSIQPSFGRRDPQGSAAGVPNVIFPAGVNDHGQPINLQLQGKAFDDLKLMGFAYAFEAKAAGRVAPPTSVTPVLPFATTAGGTVGGTVPATLSLSLGAPATFGAFTPGVEKDYAATSKATVISTAGDAALTVSEPGHLANGSFTLAEPLRVSFSKASWTAPVSNDIVDITFNQLIKRTDPLRTGTYSKTLTFTLSTTTP